MTFAHLPAGYILTKKIQSCCDSSGYLWLGLLASILPDAGIVYLFLNNVTNYRNVHHDYWTHYPLYWMIIGLTLYTLACFKNNRSDIIAITIFMSNVFLHLMLDTVTGNIKWLYPFSGEYHSLFARLSDILGLSFQYTFWKVKIYWTIILEIGIAAWAFILFMKAREQIVDCSCLTE